MKLSSILLFALALLLFPGGQALVMASDDIVSIEEPIEDDLFASGDMVYIKAPVESAIIAAGDVEIDAPIRGDLIVFGGEVDVNSDVGGKIVAAGGTIDIRGDVARNVVLAGGTVEIGPESEIGKDAAISGGNVRNAGKVNGRLWVAAENFEDEGTAGEVKLSQWDREREEDAARAARGMSFVWILWMLGFLIVGLLILKLFPSGANAVNLEINDNPVVKALVGLGLIVASFIFMVISAFTIIGLPLSILFLILLVAVWMLASLFVSLSLGKKIAAALNKEFNDFLAFTLGFLILNLLFAIPIVGWIAKLISISLGSGGIVYALNRSRKAHDS